MAIFNEVVVAGVCAVHAEPVERHIQFRYGDTWQHIYRVGDTIKWGGRDIGEPGVAQVVIDAIAERCPKCGEEVDEYEVWVENDRIASVKRATGDFSREQLPEDGYLILKR